VRHPLEFMHCVVHERASLPCSYRPVRHGYYLSRIAQARLICWRGGMLHPWRLAFRTAVATKSP
jgi:hypothetical protein